MKDNSPPNIRPRNLVGFIAELPSLLAGKETLNAIFSSYNSIGDYGSGSLKTKKPGLRITVSNGGRDEDMGAFVSAATSLGSLPLMEASNEAERIACVRAAADVQQKFSDFSGNIFAAVYAGLNAYEESVAFAKMIRQMSPAAYIVVVTCDCRMQEKQGFFDANSDVIDALIVTPMCGGRGAMGAILDALIDLWPASAPKN